MIKLQLPSPDTFFSSCSDVLEPIGTIGQTLCGIFTTTYCGFGRAICQGYTDPPAECTGFLGNDCIYPKTVLGRRKR